MHSGSPAVRGREQMKTEAASFLNAIRAESRKRPTSSASTVAVRKANSNRAATHASTRAMTLPPSAGTAPSHRASTTAQARWAGTSRFKHAPNESVAEPYSSSGCARGADSIAPASAPSLLSTGARAARDSSASARKAAQAASAARRSDAASSASPMPSSARSSEAVPKPAARSMAKSMAVVGLAHAQLGPQREKRLVALLGESERDRRSTPCGRGEVGGLSWRFIGRWMAAQPFALLIFWHGVWFRQAILC